MAELVRDDHVEKHQVEMPYLLDLVEVCGRHDQLRLLVTAAILQPIECRVSHERHAPVPGLPKFDHGLGGVRDVAGARQVHDGWELLRKGCAPSFLRGVRQPVPPVLTYGKTSNRLSPYRFGHWMTWKIGCGAVLARRE